MYITRHNSHIMLLLFTLNILPFSVRSIDPQRRLQRADKICSSYGYKVLEAKFAREKHLLCLKVQAIGSSPLTSHLSTLLLDPGADEELGGQKFPLADITMAYGFPVEDPNSGSAEGYIGEDHHFYGVLHLDFWMWENIVMKPAYLEFVQLKCNGFSSKPLSPMTEEAGYLLAATSLYFRLQTRVEPSFIPSNRTLHADPYGIDDPNKFFGVFENDHMIAPKRPRRDHDQYGAGFDQLLYFPFRIEGRQRKLGIARARLCDLLLLADKEFFENDANSSLNHVVQRMIHAVARADLIFRNTDFDEDGVPDNIGFSVKYIVVLTSNDTNTRVFGDLVKDRAIDGKSYLMQFARLRRLSEVCLGVAFSGHAFLNKTLGLSFTSLGGGLGGAAGGLCDRRAYGKSFNTLAVAHATTELTERVPERIAALTLSHELGHSFGAHHDDHYPNPECQGYIMGPHSAPSFSRHHSEFSVCSKRLIASTLSSMSYCLSELDRPYCGNGIVEEGESCDCGLPSLCSLKDPCCTPRAGGALLFEEGALHKEGCSVAPTAICHPSQGLCCNANCNYANLTNSGIDCTTQERQCTCPNSTSECHCGLGGRCLPDGTCHAAECAILGLRECKCTKNGPGGVITKARKCGVCCTFKTSDHSEKCIGAELAARTLNVIAKVPANWPDDHYRGPNVSIHLCHKGKCTFRQLRAWPPGDFCVSLNTVGVCSPRGQCGLVAGVPASNIYPDILNVKTARHTKKLSRTDRSGLNSIIAYFYTILIIEEFYNNIFYMYYPK